MKPLTKANLSKICKMIMNVISQQEFVGEENKSKNLPFVTNTRSKNLPGVSEEQIKRKEIVFY
jgi:hypothetical protein